MEKTLCLEKNDKTRMKVVCKIEDHGWCEIFASKMQDSDKFSHALMLFIVF